MRTISQIPQNTEWPQDASAWLLALNRSPDDEALLEAFDAWLDAGEEHVSQWQDALRTWQVLGAETAPGNVVQLPETVRRRSTRGRWIMAGVAGIAAAIVLTLAAPNLLLRLEADYITGAAERQQIALDDGSVVTLDGGSALAVHYSDGRRSVALLRGQAFFEVEPEAARPFVVAANGTETRVLGTAFDVRLINGGALVAVDHGRVSVGAETPLVAGDWIEVASNGQATRGTMPPELVGTWRSGMLAVQDRSIADVVETIRRHYAGQIIVLDGAFAAKHVNGVYDLGHPEDALSAVVRAHGGHVQQIAPWVLVVTGG